MPSKKNENPKVEQFKIYGHELLAKVKELLKKGNIERLIIKNEKGKTIMEVPMTVAFVGAIAAPMIAAIGAVAALVNRCTLEVVKKK
jgi:hypothetical protein